MRGRGSGSQAKTAAGLDEQGNLVGLHARISGQSINAFLNPALVSGGIDEPTISVVSPAVLNAIHAATGKPVRDLPLKNVKLV